MLKKASREKGLPPHMNRKNRKMGSLSFSRIAFIDKISVERYFFWFGANFAYFHDIRFGRHYHFKGKRRLL